MTNRKRKKRIPRQERIKRPNRPDHAVIELKQMIGLGLGIASLFSNIFQSINETKNDENDITDKVSYDVEKEIPLQIENN